VAYVVRRRGGRFEIRESVLTEQGPRARSLANFKELTPEVMAAARRRATRPFDAAAVRASASRASEVAALRGLRGEGPSGGVAVPKRQEAQRFVESSRRMAAAVEARPPGDGSGRDPGAALIDLLGFVAQIAAFRPPPSREPLRFPPLARLRAERLADVPH
jgi:hypothetical protein